MLSALLIVFSSKLCLAQLMVNDSDQSQSGLIFSADYGHGAGYVYIQTTDPLPSGCYVVLLSISAIGYDAYNNGTYLGDNENDDPDTGHFTDLSDYTLDYASYDHVDVTVEMYYNDGYTTRQFKHVLTYIYWPY